MATRPVCRFQPYQPAIREVAGKTSTPLIDVETAMRERSLNWREIVTDDGIHLQQAANRPYAEVVFEGLKPLLDANSQAAG